MSATLERAYLHPELSVVSLTRSVEVDGVRIAKGARGTVVHVYAGERAYIVEFEDPHAVVTLEAELLF